MNKYIQTEQQVQANYWWTYKAGNIFAFVFIFIIAYNGHDTVSFFGLCILIAFNAMRVPTIIKKFNERTKHVTFKTQIENLYVYSNTENDNDEFISNTFKETVNYLKVVGNKHEVRVHLILFRDVQIFTWWWDASDKLQKISKPRAPLSSSETWEEYLQSIDLFEKIDRDERLRQLRKDGAGFDWVNENIFSQQ